MFCYKFNPSVNEMKRIQNVGNALNCFIFDNGYRFFRLSGDRPSKKNSKTITGARLQNYRRI